jgi:hypothetical protein
MLLSRKNDHHHQITTLSHSINAIGPAPHRKNDVSWADHLHCQATKQRKRTDIDCQPTSNGPHHEEPLLISSCLSCAYDARAVDSTHTRTAA